MKTTVVHHKLVPFVAETDVLIDRTTKWGNPFKDGTREENVAAFDELLQTIMVLDPSVRSTIKRELGGKRLRCWCKTKREPDRLCHGDVLARIADEEDDAGGIDASDQTAS